MDISRDGLDSSNRIEEEEIELNSPADRPVPGTGPGGGSTVVVVPSSTATQSLSVGQAKWMVVKMSIRRVRGSFRGSLRRYGSVEAGKKIGRNSNWIYKKGEWKIAYGNYAPYFAFNFNSMPLCKCAPCAQ